MANPKVFISYSWTNDDYQNKIVSFARRLKSDGINVVIDVWDLKIGDNKYSFMEKCIGDPSINHVLIFSDIKYAQKANDREGGVGNETDIIAPVLYSSNNKGRIIPIVMERYPDGNPCLPISMRSLMFIDFSDERNIDKEYNKLLQFLYEEHSIDRLYTGKKTVLHQNISNISPEISDDISFFIYDRPRELIYNGFIDLFKPFYKKDYYEHKLDNSIYDFEFIHDLIQLKYARNCILDYSQYVIQNNNEAWKEIGDLLEFLQNSLTEIRTFEKNYSSYKSISFEIFRFICWEIFICITAIFLHFERFDDLHKILTRTFFLYGYDPRSFKEPMTYLGFFNFSGYIEKVIKPKIDNKTDIPYAAKLLCLNREYEPICNRTAIANADLFLFQVFPGLNLKKTGFFNNWIPKCYMYSDWRDSIWRKTVSANYCKKMYPLFGVTSLDEFKACIQKCEKAQSLLEYKYFKKAPIITDLVKITEMGAYN